MRRKLCLGCSLAGSRLCLSSSPCWNSVVLLDIQQLHVTKNVVYVTKIIGLPLISGIMLLWLASIYRQMLTLGSRRSDCSFLNLAIFMMKFEFSCQSLELISHLAQPVCLNKHRGGCSFPLPNQLQIFSTHPFHSYFWTKHPHLLFPLQS